MPSSPALPVATSMRSRFSGVTCSRPCCATCGSSRRPPARTSPGRRGWRWPADSAADHVLEAIATRAARALIAELPPDQAEVVTLRVVAGLDVAQVAEIVGKRAGAVRVLAHRGLRRLAERLGADLPASRRVG